MGSKAAAELQYNCAEDILQQGDCRRCQLECTIGQAETYTVRCPLFMKSHVQCLQSTVRLKL